MTVGTTLALGVVFLFGLFSLHLPVVPVPDLAPLRQARHLAELRAAEQRQRPAFFLERAFHSLLLHRPGGLPADGIQTEDLRRVARVRLRPQVAACRIVDVQALAHDSAAESAPPHLVPRLVLPLVVEPGDDLVPAAAVVHPRKLIAV